VLSYKADERLRNNNLGKASGEVSGEKKKPKRANGAKIRVKESQWSALENEQCSFREKFTENRRIG